MGRGICVVLLALAAFAAAPAQAQSFYNIKDCSIIVGYSGDYGGEKESRLMGRINNYILQNVAIDQRLEAGSPAEGELCLIMHDTKDANQAYADIKAMIPAKSTKAWTSVYRHGKSFKTRWPDEE